MINELDLEKAKAKSLASHFKKSAAFHEKKSDHHEKCAKAHEAAASHHEGMIGKDMEMAAGGNPHKEHHKAKMAFHKTMQGHHEKCAKLHKAHAEHNSAMADAHDATTDEQKKAAFTKLGIDLEKVSVQVADPVVTTTITPTTVPAVDPVVPVTPPVADPAPALAAAATVPEVVPANPTGDQPMIKTAEQLAAEAAAAPSTTTLAAATNAMTEDPNNPVQKLLREGMQEALKNALKENLASPEFRKVVQEQLANVMLTEMGKQTLLATPVKTFAVARTNAPLIDATKVASIASGATPSVSTEGVDPQFAHLVSMDS